MDRADSAWIRIGRPGAVDVVFERGRHGAISGRVGTRYPGRRHRAGPQSGNYSLPHFRIGGWVGDVQGVELKSGGTEFPVMAGDAVRVEERAGNCGSASDDAAQQERHDQCRRGSPVSPRHVSHPEGAHFRLSISRSYFGPDRCSIPRPGDVPKDHDVSTPRSCRNPAFPRKDQSLIRVAPDINGAPVGGRPGSESEEHAEWDNQPYQS